MLVLDGGVGAVLRFRVIEMMVEQRSVMLRISLPVELGVCPGFGPPGFRHLPEPLLTLSRWHASHGRDPEIYTFAYGLDPRNIQRSNI